MNALQVRIGTTLCTISVHESGLDISGFASESLWAGRLRRMLRDRPSCGRFVGDSAVSLMNEFFLGGPSFTEDEVASSGDPEVASDFMSGIFLPADLKVKVRSSGAIGWPDLKVSAAWTMRESGRPLTVVGIFGICDEGVVLMPDPLRAVIYAISSLNEGREKGKDQKARDLRDIYAIKMAAKQGLVEVDAFLSRNEVELVDKCGINVVDDAHGLTIVPVLPGVATTTMVAYWQMATDPSALMDFQEESGRRRVLASDRVMAVLDRLHKYGRQRKGKDRDRLVSNPLAIFDGADSSELEALDPAMCGERVTGIAWERPESPLVPVYGTQNWFGSAPHAPRQASPGKQEASSEVRAHLAVANNFESVTYAAPNGESVVGIKHEGLPKALLFRELKEHQVQALRWLQNLYCHGPHRGALLADDMGLGKTLQTLCFLAWAREQHMAAGGHAFRVLLIAPKSLYDEWVRQLDRFFSPNALGGIRRLDDGGARSLRSSKMHVANGEIVPALDIARLGEVGVLIANRDQLVRYQFSLAQVDWHIMVVDEAQLIKNPATLAARAVRAMRSGFRLALSGTPVENRLSDLWSIVDFVQPGSALGSLRDFVARYGDVNPRSASSLAELQEAVRLNAMDSDALVVRRNKDDLVLAIPPKQMRIHRCRLTAAQVSAIAVLKDEIKNGDLGTLTGLQRLAVIYQHPWALNDQWIGARSVEDLIVACEKLSLLLKILEEVAASGEKAIIFTRSLKVQHILQEVITVRTSAVARILNGTSSTSERTNIVDRFNAKDGFDCLIVSPEVGGIGLTLTAANHVIHYGRWWNPAQERQATDRVHRMSQRRPVYVHYLMAEAPSAVGASFDDLLEELHGKKRSLFDGLFGGLADMNAPTEELLSNAITPTGRNKALGDAA